MRQRGRQRAGWREGVETGSARAQGMTEEQWATSDDAWGMLHFLRSAGTVSDRKLRLVAVACVQSLAHLYPCLREMVETIELYADERAGWNDLAAVRKKARVLSREAMQKPLG